MTNQELQNSFRLLVSQSTNIFDVYLEVSKLKDEYKTTSFFKETHKSIYDAFELYLRGIGQIDYLATLFNAASVEDINSVINIIAESLNLDNVFNTMSPEDKELMKNLIPLLQK